jgi:hypothetical protein
MKLRRRIERLERQLPPAPAPAADRRPEWSVASLAEYLRELFDGVETYLERAFSEHLPAMRAAMTKLAKSYKPRELADAAFGLYEKFRPAIPAGVARSACVR